MNKKLLLTGSLALVLTTFKAQWMTQNTNFTNSIYGVSSINIPSANVAWAIGYNGSGTTIATNPEYTMTKDGGATWTANKINTAGVTSDFVIANISAIDDVTAFACLYDNKQSAGQGIYKTTDGGTSWTRCAGAAYGTSSWPDLVHFFNANDGVAFGDPVGGFYEIYTTNDGGTTWAQSPNTANVLAPIPAAEYGLANSFGVFGNTICVGTNHGRIFRSVDKGVTWTVSTTPLTLTSANATDIHKIEFRDANNAIAGSVYINNVSKPVYSFIKTTDGGITWTSVTSTGAVFGSDYCAVPGTNFYVSTGADFTTPNQGSSMSSDDGATWQLIEDTTGFSAGSTGQRTAVKFFSSTLGYAGGFTGNPSTNGGIFKWSGTLSPYVGIEKTSSLKSSISVYPTPCDDNLSIVLNGIKDKKTNVKICNALGELVYESSTIYQTPMFIKHVNVSSFSKGIYFVIVNEGANSYVQKVIKE